MRHTAHTREVDAPQEEQGAREEAGNDMAEAGAGGPTDDREVVGGARVELRVENDAASRSPTVAEARAASAQH